MHRLFRISPFTFGFGVVVAATTLTFAEANAAPPRRPAAVLRVNALPAHSAPVSTSLSVLLGRSVGAAELASLHKTLDRIARVSKRGESAVAMRRMILRALAAPTQAESRQIMRQLQARLATRTTVATSGDRVSGPSQASDECTTVDQGVTWVDECTTVEEEEEAIAITEALEVELTADHAEASNECIGRYGYEGCWATEASSDRAHATTAQQFSQPSLAFGPRESKLFTEVFDETADCSSPATAEPHDDIFPGRFNCIEEANDAAVGMAEFLFASAAYKYIFGGNSRKARNFKNAAVGSLFVMAWSAGWGIGTLYNCAVE